MTPTDGYVDVNYPTAPKGLSPGLFPPFAGKALLRPFSVATRPTDIKSGGNGREKVISD